MTVVKNAQQPPLIAHVIFRLGIGGLENGLINLINNMPTDQYRHMIICLKGSTEFRERLKRKDVQIIDLQKKDGQDWRSFIRLYRILKQHKVDIIHTRNLAAIEYQVPAFLAGVKLRVHSEHGWDTFDPEGNNKKYQCLRRLLSPLIKVFIPLSLHLQDYLVEKVKIPKSKIKRICNGVDIKKFYPTTVRSDLFDCPLPFDEKNVYIGTVGRMHGVKDQITLVTAFILLVQAHQELIGQVYLILIGDGPLRQEAMALLAKHQLLQTAWLPGEREDIADIMRSLDIFVLPSQAEGISNTILEAMATGLPVIATAVGGNSELVMPSETGLLVPPSDPEAMSEAMLSLLIDKDKRQKLSENSYQRVLDHFSIQAMVTKYTEVYDSLGLKGK
ncbi:MAG: TIGR03088 family PEP-CTERM/XrtA system glycosyltransferase [Methyloprofundus sp.]|nr:TIGR03088 family PEP-CTERM/XrtA system glycosyltransferase [Methyloprofundus sp.]MDT8425658.1 TIGR03088 family PEP-CTERM/XrtA system glycosyltransferase [Methyloprofundus sp.]